MGALMRAFDWAQTPLGPVETWPASLRTSVSTLLTTRHPMFLWWGPELIQFYNDGYRLSLGPDRHPSALGQRGRECWAEIWSVIGPEVDSIMAGGEATWHEDFLIPITRGDRVEDVYWSYSYSPVQDDSGGVGGVLVTVQETTQRVIAERRRQTLRELGDLQVASASIQEVGASAAAALEANPSDVAFALVYLRDQTGVFRLAGSAGVEAGTDKSPHEIPIEGGGPWPVAQVLVQRAPIIVPDLPGTVGSIHRYLWPVPVREAVALPLIAEGSSWVEGVLIAGANPRIRLDQSYEAFFTDVARVIALGMNKVHNRDQERRTEQQLRDVERLQSVGALAGGVAHEVNNQMTVVLGFGEFVLKALGPNHPQAADMRLVLLAGNRAARVSQQLLTFTRQQLTRPRVLELHGVTTGLEPVLRQLLGSDKTLVIVPSVGVSPISADPTQIEQVLINLVANARDATPTGGRVTISIEDVELTEAGTAHYGVAVVPGPYVLLTVADTGHGMDDATAARIFEPFFTTKAVGQGTGLGLSMVYGIVKRHEGYIWAESVPGHGTTMRLYWPAAPGAVVEVSGEHGIPDGLEPDELLRTVWVVEDEMAVRELVARTLVMEGLRVVSAADGAEALKLLEQEHVPPTLVITDLVMPHVNGRQVSNAVAARHPDVPVLFMSGYASDDVVRRGLMPENAAFLQKPFTPAELVQRLEAMLQRPDVFSAR
jgi:signal transduction histidine kinase/ActR/RegA family two-component response regulator